MAMKSKKLDKMRMPDKRGREEELDLESLDVEEDLPEEEMDMESMSEELPEGEPESVESPSNPALEAVSDEELMAELEKRGLSAKLGDEELDEEMEGPPDEEPLDEEELDQDMYT